MLGEAIELAAAGGDEVAEWRARVAWLWVRQSTEVDISLESVRSEAEEAIRVLNARGDNRGLASSWRLLGDVHNTCGRAAAWRDALEHAVEHAWRAGDDHELWYGLWLLGGSLFFGPTPVGEATARCEQLRVAAGGRPVAEAAVARARRLLLPRR